MMPPQIAAASEAATRKVSRYFWPVSVHAECREHGDRHDATRDADLQVKPVQEDDRKTLGRQVAGLPGDKQRLQPTYDPRDRTLREVPLPQATASAPSESDACSRRPDSSRGPRHRSRESVERIEAAAGYGILGSRRRS